jgi:hypothetical protein
MKREY